jgi:hypothetical protein
MVIEMVMALLLGTVPTFNWKKAWKTPVMAAGLLVDIQATYPMNAETDVVLHTHIYYISRKSKSNNNHSRGEYCTNDTCFFFLAVCNIKWLQKDGIPSTAYKQTNKQTSKQKLI